MGSPEAEREEDRKSHRRERSRSPGGGSRHRSSRDRSRERGSRDRSRSRERDNKEPGRERDRAGRRSRFAMDPPAENSAGATALQQQQQQQQQMLAQHQQQLIAQQFMAQQRQQQLLLQQAQMANQARLQAQNKKQREIYVGNLTVGLVTAPVLQELFNGALAHLAEGKVPVVGINMDSSMKFAFVEFSTEELATAALHLDKVELCGRNINVGRPKGYIDPSTPGYVKAPDVDPPAAGLAGLLGGAGLPGAMPGAMPGALPGPPGLPGGGLPGAAAGNPLLGLMGQQGVAAAAAPAAAPAAPAVGTTSTAAPGAEQPPTCCVFLENMVSATELMDPEERTELQQDVKEECERSGSVLGVHVPTPPAEAVNASAPGRVYVKFGEKSAAIAAQRALNGRIFAGNKVKAVFVTEFEFDQAGTGKWFDL
mmetsp:Transcript_25375/g.30746  ORF Transcript_25375/g.30746 Transcript_25375/m.30746 type:complete len:425 (-) Transcript_25375:1788-3062(-)|eukprot:CAMPEP_0197864852 /NCGR_PEP_ID=MMETSP1438-20131217/43325_1 /TAXON_ID=1461541 /ORGANISM="Pterosperma sp., Strain CCMP1384" /LENGTH=424 /DNA_ID=CAMNT_0043483225 /DNA_START=199 /DNA_END=1473 /DNA_ORIENTATION=-